VAEAMADAYPVPIKRVGIADRFAETGPYFEMLDRYGMSVPDIVAAARQAVAAKRR
jgi:transketolase